MIQYGAMLKLWVLGALLVGILVPRASGGWASIWPPAWPA